MNFQQALSPTRGKSYLILITLLLILVVSYFGLQKLSVTIDTRAFFEDNSHLLAEFNQINRKYGEASNIGILVIPAAGDVFDKSVLAVLDQFTQAANKVQYAGSIDSLLNYPYAYDQDGELNVEPMLRDYATKSQAELNIIKQRYLNDSTLKGHLISAEGTLTVAIMSLNIPDKDTRSVQGIYRQVEQIVVTLRQQNPALDIRVIGSVSSDYAFATATQQELAKRMPVSIAIVVFLLLFMLRSFTGVFITLFITALSSLIAFGLKGYVNGSITPVSGMAPTTIFTLAIADCVHLLSGFQLLLVAGQQKRAAIIESLRLNYKAVTLTSVTTLIGFLCFNFSSSPAIRDMGNVVAVGVVVAWGLTLFVMPLIILALPYPVPKIKLTPSMLFLPLANFVSRRPGFIVAVFSVLVLVFMLGLPRNQINEVMIEMFDHSYDLRKNAELLNAKLTGVSRLYFDIPTQVDKNVNDLEYLQALDKFTLWLRAQPNVRGVDSYSEFLKKLNQTLNNSEQHYRLPETTEMAAQYLLLYEASMPTSGGLENFIAVDRGSSRLEAQIDLGDSQSILALKRASELWLTQHAPSYMQVEATSFDVLFAETSIKNAEAMYYGTIASLLLVSLLVAAAIRDGRLGLISFVANLLPILIAYGIWGFVNGRIGISEAMVASLTMGLVVDDTIHFLTKFQDQLKRTPGRLEEAIRYAYQNAGYPIVMTTVVFVASFSTFLSSNYLPNVQLSSLTMLTLSLALLFDMLFLPAVLILFYPAKQAVQELPSSVQHQPTH